MTASQIEREREPGTGDHAAKTEPEFNRAEIFDAMASRVVKITNDVFVPELNYSVAGIGSGVFVSSGDPRVCEVATVKHTLDGTLDDAIVEFGFQRPRGRHTLSVHTANGETYLAQPEMIDAKNQIAILKVPGIPEPEKNCKPTELDTTPSSWFQPLFGIGGSKLPGRYHGFSEMALGTISLLPWLPYDVDPLENTSRATITMLGFGTHGDSGGPIFNKDKKIVGLLDYGKGYLGFAEPASAVQEVLNAIRRQREQRQAQHQ